VKRSEEYRFDLSSLDKPKLYVKYALTILNENGDEHAVFEEYYSKLREISYIEGALYDSKGKKIKSLKKDEIKDYSGTGGENLIEDDRIKYHNFYCRTYPYTVEYEYELKFNTLWICPQWFPQEAYNFSVQQSKVTVITPSSYTIRYKAFNYKGEPLQSAEKNNIVYTWQVANLPALTREFASPSLKKISVNVMFGPTKFRFEKYDGDMSDWAGWGKFMNVLRQNRDELPDDVKRQVHQMTDTVQDTRQKIKILYEYLQKNTRYVSIQLGIGGWQPFDAKFVSEKKYGDCKALSNFMCALLKEAGIKSYYAAIYAGDNADDMEVDFPSNQFNHITLCVPVKGDSIWLECTSQTKAPGYIGGWTGNRHAVLVTEDGAKVAGTTRYGLEDNLELRKITGTLTVDGNFDFVSKTQFKAMEKDDLHEIINSYSKDKIMEYLKREITLPTYDVVRYDYAEDKERVSSLYETIEITASNYAQASGKRIFINPNIVNRYGRRLRQDTMRKYDIIIREAYRDVDSVEIKIPWGYVPEAIPQDIRIENKFGKYIATVKVLSDKIVYYRLHDQYNGTFQAADYPAMVAFYEQMFKDDRQNVVLVKAQ
jgi:hypothetical protein